MKKVLYTILLLAGISLVYLYQQSIPPTGGLFPVIIQYEKDQTVIDFINMLHEKRVIKDRMVFKTMLVITGYDEKIKPNVYTFRKAENVFQVLFQFMNDSRVAKGIKVLIPEGSTNKEIIAIVEDAFPNLKGQINLYADNEGYYFPDTYYFSINSDPVEIESILRNTFTEKTNELFLTKSAQDVKDIIIMASILEREGRGYEEQQTIAGILNKRMSLGIPLQVDATFLYTLGKGSSELTLTDLKKDNPYNTYTRKGLPIGPINNPGLQTIQAALNPLPSPYLYYLHDKNGGIHYAKTFEEHIRNKNKYLK
jgi:UPF0755 protein